jgi:glycogen debranching enzyme
VPEEVAPRVADRLLAPDLFSGWGVRSLSSEHPSYNPFAYHLGSVWPVENATFALGLKRYGLDEQAIRLASSVLAAADGCPEGRLPEALSGLGRDESVLPVPYPNANSPQAWSAGATIQLLQTMLGIYPFAPAATLTLVRPRLPEGVEEVVLRRLRVGKATVSLRFRRRDDGVADHEVLERDGPLLVVEAPPPQDVSGEADPGERLKSWALERMPGRLARALRIALGIE